FLDDVVLHGALELLRVSPLFLRQACSVSEEAFFSSAGTTRRKRGCRMAVENYGEKYLCRICGNKVEVIEVGGGTLVCCGEDMKRVKEKPETMVNLPDSGG
ncbi:MAG: desulfoferrodoxin FeS4 iron-binding domain-containing protein, partial [Dehalococcoidia bacterium]